MFGDIHKLFGHDTGEVEPVENPGWRGLILKDSSCCEGTMVEPFDCRLRWGAETVEMKTSD